MAGFFSPKSPITIKMAERVLGRNSVFLHKIRNLLHARASSGTALRNLVEDMSLSMPEFETVKSLG